MTEEIDLYGVFLPSFLVWLVLAFVILLVLKRALAAFGLYKYVWHRPLFDLALYVVTAGAVVAIARSLQ